MTKADDKADRKVVSSLLIMHGRNTDPFENLATVIIVTKFFLDIRHFILRQEATKCPPKKGYPLTSKGSFFWDTLSGNRN